MLNLNFMELVRLLKQRLKRVFSVLMFRHHFWKLYKSTWRSKNK